MPCWGQGKANPCVFRTMVDVEVTSILCVHDDDLVVAATDKTMFNRFHAQSHESFPVNYMGDISLYPG